MVINISTTSYIKRPSLDDFLQYGSKPRHLSDAEIKELQNSEQIFSDCYLTAGVDALTRSENGKKLLKNNISKNPYNPNIVTYSLYSPDGKKEDFTVNVTPQNSKYEKLNREQKNGTIRGLDLSVVEFEKKYNTKPFICKFSGLFKKYKFENYLPSRFLKLITGIEPTTIAETDFNINLTKHKEEVLKLFKRMSNEKDYSFVIMNGLKKFNGRRFHVYVIENVDMNKQEISIKNKRGNITQTISFDEALKTFKSISGYFNKDLAAE